MTHFDGRELLLLLMLTLVLGWYVVTGRNGKNAEAIDEALNHPHEGEPRAVVCPVHGHLCTVFTDRDMRLELEAHHVCEHEGAR